MWELLSTGEGTDSPEPRSSHTCALVHDAGAEGSRVGSMLVFGGSAKSRDTDTATVVADVWRLSMEESEGGTLTASWQQLLPSGAGPGARFDHTAIAYGGGLLIYGGCLTSAAFSDIWLLEDHGDDDDPLPLPEAYSWRQVHYLGPPPPAPPFPMQPPPMPPVGNVTGVPPPPPPSPPPPLPAPPFLGHGATPGARCAHSAVATERGMIIFGGRVPLPTRLTYGVSSSNDPAWLTLSDAWVFDIDRALQVDEGTYSGDESEPSGWESLPLAMQTSEGTIMGASVAVNRSDHSAVLLNGNVMIFGGLYTDVSENTIYIMKDFVNMKLPASLGGPSGSRSDGRALLHRLPWGPAWRFDHTMVIAPRVAHPDPRADGRTLEDAPVLYGGGGGMEIFGDSWVYDRREGAWYALDAASEPATRVSIVTSMLFGTVGFGMYACVIICVFIRRVTRSRSRQRYANWPPGQRMAGGRDEFAPARQTQNRRGAPTELIDALPRVLWGDVVKKVGGGSDEVSASSKPAADAASSSQSSAAGDAAGDSSTTAPSSEEKAAAALKADDEDTELCAVCLCPYEMQDTLLRLPCEHLFHEACVARWLQQDSSCPQCRFQLLPPLSPPAAARSSVDPEQGGTELTGQPIGRRPSQSAAVAPHITTPAAAAAANAPAVSAAAAASRARRNSSSRTAGTAPSAADESAAESA